MNGVIASDEDYPDFVEVDPTGRYGRVSTYSYLFTAFMVFYVILNLGSCLFEPNLIKFNAFCSIMKFWAEELQRQCMISIPFSSLCTSLKLFDVKV